MNSKGSSSRQTESLLTSGRLCVTCLASSMALISDSSTSHIKADALAPDVKERPVCRNCMDSGAIICRGKLVCPVCLDTGLPNNKSFLEGLITSNRSVRCIMDDYFQTQKVQFGSRVIHEHGI